MFLFTRPGSRFGDRHLKVPKTAKTHFSGTLPRNGSINWSNICKREETASVGLPNIPIGFPARCILLYRPKVKKCMQMQVLGSFSCVLQTDVFITYRWGHIYNEHCNGVRLGLLASCDMQDTRWCWNVFCGFRFTVFHTVEACLECGKLCKISFFNIVMSDVTCTYCTN